MHDPLIDVHDVLDELADFLRFMQNPTEKVN